ncbi:3-hydroxyacyl-CoA dehydrogenase [Nocardioides luteus]|uniref:3-hydroxyacyl-CoA dehydrogenase n=1 Tax=Nocardioides luteus TaxID=1844 RepID=A0ABQ5SZK4_9ACTN|nr:3-hydroxyacyl-CoA dehydrogenase NAD-binding domain-containing protein [Nocardioides luteus]MDR7312631.1 3-hydroxyacyl-CoA dehydrogenase [Nocardioides luteus]GGR46453.1 3-hydroxyacyl-CoA dehydrogenase [Nocardioides luteus]GLJ68879.1 3-hydroxyacyl-CoA dehydrogenase [Nocardioides luteus]
MRSGEDVRTLGVVGTGAIGVSWVALGLEHGLDVVAWDPAEGAEERLRAQVAPLVEPGGRLRPSVSRPTQSSGALRFAESLDELGTTADLVLESGPERLEVKREIFAALDAAAAPDVLLTSSSSGLMPSTFQDACTRHPERVLVAHPFNPPQLMPLVEVVGGSATSPEAVEAALETLRHLGKRPIHIRREVPGHVANRLQAALWREAYHLVDEGIVSVADIDTAISDGPGLRWSLLGPFATQHLSGGPGGLGHVLEHLGPPMVEWWDDLGHPELTPELTERLVEGVGDELDGTPAEELVARRDQALRRLLEIKTDLGLG